MYVICPSPLVKCYLTEWHDRLLENPDILEDTSEAFSFTVPAACGGFRLKFNTPMHITSLGRKMDNEKDMETAFQWLVGLDGDRSSETDCYGIVPFDPQIDLVDTQDQMALLEEQVSNDTKASERAKKKLEELRKTTALKLKNTRESTRRRSDARIKRAMKTVHNNLIRQWQINEEMKMGKYPPSITEMLGAKVLTTEIAAATAKGAKIKAHMTEVMKQSVV